MDLEIAFRWVFGGVLGLSMLISGWHRAKARRETGTIPRLAEGPLAVVLRLGLTLPLLATIVLELVAPEVLAWARLDLPPGLRLAAAAVALGCPLLVWWVVASIGSNISETVLTKTDHRLVQHGPYRWVRHPLYAVALLALLALGLMTADGLLIALWGAGVGVFRFLVIPREEANLIARFGQTYERYRRTTGALLPWPGGPM
ncbi:MAG: isoprenylcysteine carboxylmethyltransferase family protein [Anaerolineales bacterium]|nr:isoprenylcysteine carboxylmethyltransferase family protein [Anaerolineales bacterium]